MKKIFFIFQILVTGIIAQAQQGIPNNVTDPNTTAKKEFLSVKGDDWRPSLRTDGAIDRVQHVGVVTPWATIRENDVIWKKRLWRLIDTRQKQNFAFRFSGDEETGGGYFIEILLNAIKKGDITAFDPIDDRFTSDVKWDDIQVKLAGKVDTNYMPGVGGQDSMFIIKREFLPEDVTRFKIKEDVIFDRNLGRAVTRIIGIAPIIDKRGEDGVIRSQQTLFWLYYPDLRPILANYQVFNPDNEVFRSTWDDYFEGHRFSSYIYKTSNGSNTATEEIKDYKKGLDRLYESEKIKETLFNKEHDMWVY
jgi:gliding motility associated protien GldN